MLITQHLEEQSNSLKIIFWRRFYLFMQILIVKIMLVHLKQQDSEKNPEKLLKHISMLMIKMLSSLLDQVFPFSLFVFQQIFSILLGSTGAINKLVDVLLLKHPTVRDQTVVFISTFEHHSNILPWKETGVEVIDLLFQIFDIHLLSFL